MNRNYVKCMTVVARREVICVERMCYENNYVIVPTDLPDLLEPRRELHLAALALQRRSELLFLPVSMG